MGKRYAFLEVIKMKTLEEFYSEIVGSVALQDELKKIQDETALASFLGKHGCSATAKEFVDFVRSHAEGAIEDDDATTVAGGFTSAFGLWGDMAGFHLPKF